MLKTLRKDLKKRLFFSAREFFLIILKFINKSQVYTLNKNTCSYLKLTYNNMFARSSLHCFCIISSRSRSVFSKYRISRIVFKSFGSAMQTLLGVTKL